MEKRDFQWKFSKSPYTNTSGHIMLKLTIHCTQGLFRICSKRHASILNTFYFIAKMSGGIFFSHPVVRQFHDFPFTEN